MQRMIVARGADNLFRYIHFAQLVGALGSAANRYEEHRVRSADIMRRVVR
jgi:hypothetical protein